jgi:undecaprenyl-diphosphatase
MTEEPTRSTTKLLAPAWRRVAGGVALACAVVVVALGLAVRGQRSGTAFDDEVDARVMRDVPTGVLNTLLHLTDPVPMALALAAVAVLAALRRRWPVCAVAVVAPLLALGLTEAVLKPLVHRTQQGLLAYPSGHESAPGCLATMLALLVLRSTWSTPAKIAGVSVLVLFLAACAIGLIGAFFHYATDTIGAVCLSVACVLITALIADRQLT